MLFSPCQVGSAVHDYEKRGTQKQKSVFSWVLNYEAKNTDLDVIKIHIPQLISDFLLRLSAEKKLPNLTRKFTLGILDAFIKLHPHFVLSHDVTCP